MCCFIKMALSCPFGSLQSWLALETPSAGKMGGPAFPMSSPALTFKWNAGGAVSTGGALESALWVVHATC